MLRDPQHERKNLNHINSHPFVLNFVEGLCEGFSVPASRPAIQERYQLTKADVFHRKAKGRALKAQLLGQLAHI
jgi:hypothetical protein